MAFEVMDAYYVYIFDRKMSALATEQRKLSERYHEQMLEYVDLGLQICIRDRNIFCQENIYEYNQPEQQPEVLHPD